MKSRKRALSVLFSVALLLLAVVLFWRWFHNARPQVCRMRDGTTLTLLGVTYGRHHVFSTPALVPTAGLWEQLRALLHPQIETSRADTPTDALMLWVRSSRSRGTWPMLGFQARIEAIDSNGNRMVNDTEEYPIRIDEQWPDITPLVLRVFPRQQRNLTVRLYRLGQSYSEPDAVFHITNPAYRADFPHWTPEPIPATKAIGDLKVTLEGIAASNKAVKVQALQQAGAYSYGLMPKTGTPGLMPYGEERRVTARLRLDGKPWAHWEVANMWVTDATGNVQNTAIDWINPGGPGQGRCYLAPIANEPIRYTVECSRGTAAPFSAQEQWTAPRVEIPAHGQSRMIDQSHTDGDCTLRFIGIAGPRTDLLKPPPVGVQPQQSTPALYVEVTGPCQPYIAVTDENGKPVEVGGGQNIGDHWQKPDYMEFVMAGDHLQEHFSFGPEHGKRIIIFPLKPRSDVKRIHLTFALNRLRSFEFTVPANSGLARP